MINTRRAFCYVTQHKVNLTRSAGEGCRCGRIHGGMKPMRKERRGFARYRLIWLSRPQVKMQAVFSFEQQVAPPNCHTSVVGQRAAFHQSLSSDNHGLYMCSLSPHLHTCDSVGYFFLKRSRPLSRWSQDPFTSCPRCATFPHPLSKRRANSDLGLSILDSCLSALALGSRL